MPQIVARGLMWWKDEEIERWVGRTIGEVVGECVGDPKLRALLAAQWAATRDVGTAIRFDTTACAAPVHIVTSSATVRRLVNMTALTVIDANTKSVQA
jgi:hypothetical protein